MTDERRVQVIAGTVGVVIVAAMLFATVVDAAAQGPRFGRGGPDGPRGFIGDAGGRGGGGLGGLMRLDGLTDAQREQIRTLISQRREGLAMLAREVGEAQRALATSAETGQVDEGKADALGSATRALALARAQLQADVFGVLTAEQKAELAKRREQMRAWFDSRPDGGGRRGPGRRR
jgi:Spy/CpxP family protein refolding chaperone